uniref:Uncharacterized protein n=1 Tax=Tanacetum cinerariifolium TaxID=118510 RepID=A0A699GUS1_TANCI|nr:hypothetical protein [Tanacetum cinerariifolium]
MTTFAQQIALDNALVAPKNQGRIGKCYMRINPAMKPKEPTYQVVSDALALTTWYPAFLITANVPDIYMHQFWDTVIKQNASYQFKINNKRFYVNVEVFREILNICLKILDQEFDEPPSKEETLSFIRELNHFGEIKYITNETTNNIECKNFSWKTNEKFSQYGEMASENSVTPSGLTSDRVIFDEKQLGILRKFH